MKRLLMPFLRMWKARQQEIDRRILWPSIREQTSDINTARDAFRLHMTRDPAYNLMMPKEKDEYVRTLEE